MKKVGVVGLGLIGGSICKAIKAYTDRSVLGFDRNPDVFSAALEYGAVDAALDHNSLASCDLVLFALYPAATVDYIRENLTGFREHAVLLDLCGVKRMVCAEVEALLRGTGLTFIGGHPMAGREFSGFAVSEQDLFQNASMILTPPPSVPKEALLETATFLKTIGFGRIIDTTPEFHDRMIAFTSQLPHIIASCYVKSPTCAYQLGFTGGSFEDMSRIARMNETMWSELFLNNPDCLLSEIDTFLDHLAEVRQAIKQKDLGSLTSLLRDGRLIKEQLSQTQ